MNALVLLMTLLVASYVGSFLVGGRVIRGFGLPSGIEWVVGGFVLGPRALGIIHAPVFEAVEPVILVALGWLALVIGVEYGRVGRRPVRARKLVLGALLAGITGLAVGGAVFLALPRLVAFSPADRLLLAAAVGTASAETTRHAVRWVAERHAARGPLTDLLADVSDAEDIVPVVALAFVFASRPTAPLGVSLPNIAWVGVTAGVGLLLGGVAALLLGRDFRIRESWGVLIGTALLGIGVAARVGVSGIAVMFFMGVTLAVVSGHRDDLRALVAPTERPMLLPALLLAGVRLASDDGHPLAWVVAIALVARVLAKLTTAHLLAAVSPAARGHANSIGVGMLSSGALSIAIGLACALRFPGVIGDTVLATSAALAVAGEMVGPVTLRSVLARAGEIRPPERAPSDATSAARPAAAAGPTEPGGS